MSAIMSGILDEKYREWVDGKDAVRARVSIFEKIRDIPYAVVPRLIDAEGYADILSLGKGSCTPKHLLLCEMFQRLGLLVLYVVYPFQWCEWHPEDMDYPPRLLSLSEDMPTSYHIACKVVIDDRLVLVDATLDSPLTKFNLPVNVDWDGFSNTILPVNPCGEEELYHPSEAHLMQPRDFDRNSLEFYRELNQCLEDVRNL